MNQCVCSVGLLFALVFALPLQSCTHSQSENNEKVALFENVFGKKNCLAGLGLVGCKTPPELCKDIERDWNVEDLLKIDMDAPEQEYETPEVGWEKAEDPYCTTRQVVGCRRPEDLETWSFIAMRAGAYRGRMQNFPGACVRALREVEQTAREQWQCPTEYPIFIEYGGNVYSIDSTEAFIRGFDAKGRPHLDRFTHWGESPGFFVGFDPDQAHSRLFQTCYPWGTPNSCQ